jgi:hypothetical protein
MKHLVFRILSANATSVPCPLGNGQLGWLRITITKDLYNSLSNTHFVAPINPGYMPHLLALPTTNQVSLLQATHKEQLHLWNKYNMIDCALKQQLIGAVKSKFISAIQNCLTGFSTLTICTIMEHLLTTYGRILPSEIICNDGFFSKTFDANKPIETLYAQIQVLANALNLVQCTKMYRQACHEWRHKADN